MQGGLSSLAGPAASSGYAARLEPVAAIVRHHHERWDGAGYPHGLCGDRIPVGSRIVAVCDAYQAMTSPRPYRAALPPAAAAFELRAGAGTRFDPALVDCFVEVLRERGWPLSPPGERDLAYVEGVS
jgi:HD-GYP domain-containing protein (c-di-GMP phosphodiesterase class II)